MELLYLVSLIFTVVQYSWQSEFVPVLLWGNYIDKLTVGGVGKTIQHSEFHNKYLSHLANDNNIIIAFIKNTISVEELSNESHSYDVNSDGGALKHLKKRVENNSIHLLKVENPAISVHKLFKELKSEKIFTSIDELPIFTDTKFKSFIVKLPDEMEEADNLIELISKKLNKNNVKYTGIFTGEKSSHHSFSGFFAKNHGRHLLSKNIEDDNDEDDQIFKIGNCGLLHFTAVRLYIYKINLKTEKKVNLNCIFGLKDVDKIDNSNCNSDDKKANVYLNFKDGQCNSSRDAYTEVKNLNIIFDASWSVATNWKISSGNITFSVESKVYHSSFKSNIMADYRNCYHCSNFGPIKFSKSENGQTVKLGNFTIENFQIQIGQTKNITTVFGRAEDCTPFFSIPIISGIITGLVLFTILIFGVLMVMDITTMDRFDDPKGKHLNLGKIE